MSVCEGGGGGGHCHGTIKVCVVLEWFNSTLFIFHLFFLNKK